MTDMSVKVLSENLSWGRQATLRVGSTIPQTGTPDWIKRRKQSKMIAYGLRAFAILSKDLSSVPRPVWGGPTPSNSSSKESDAPLVSLDMALLGTCLWTHTPSHTKNKNLRRKRHENTSTHLSCFLSPCDRTPHTRHAFLARMDCVPFNCEPK